MVLTRDDAKIPMDLSFASANQLFCFVDWWMSWWKAKEVMQKVGQHYFLFVMRS